MGLSATLVWRRMSVWNYECFVFICYMWGRSDKRLFMYVSLKCVYVTMIDYFVSEKDAMSTRSVRWPWPMLLYVIDQTKNAPCLYSWCLLHTGHWHLLLSVVCWCPHIKNKVFPVSQKQWLKKHKYNGTKLNLGFEVHSLVSKNTLF